MRRWQAGGVQVTETVDVAAAPDQVWRVLADVESWPQWTASMRSVRPLEGGPLAEGSRVAVRQPRLPAAEWLVTELEEGRAFTWTAHSPGLVSVAEHVIEPRDGGCTVTLRFQQTGPLAGVVGALGGRLVRRYVAMEAAGLKRRCESGEAGPARG